MSAPADNSTKAWSTTAQAGGSQARSASSGVRDSHTASSNESASRTREWVQTVENVGMRATEPSMSALQRAADQQRSMQVLLQGITAPLGSAPTTAANQDVTYHGDGMMNDLEELYQSAKAQKK